MGRIRGFEQKTKRIDRNRKLAEHPLSVLGRTRNVIVTYNLGVPDEDNGAV